MRTHHAWLAVVTALGLAQTSCATEAYCFADCADDTPTDAGLDGNDPTDARYDTGTGGSGFNLDASTTGGDGGAVALNDENCNGQDDDADGEIDEDVDFTSVIHCGTCDTNCAAGEHLINPTCDPPPEGERDGSTPGTCAYERCETDFYDHDPLEAGCEYYCPWNPDGTNTTDPGGVDGCGRDEDCDGETDEDVETCDAIENCGRCGRKCVTPNGTPTCVTTATGDAACTEENTQCRVATCDAGWVDANDSADDGCEYQCTETNGGAEICDGLDNDCDKLIDNADADLEADDPSVGDACFGGESGICADAAHQGVAKCIGAQVRCCDPDSNAQQGANPSFPATGLRNAVCDAPTGAQVVRPGEAPEVCNGADDDCDDTIDNNLTDVGSACGASATGNCTLGTRQCVSGAPVCLGSTDPQVETCNAQDDDCDGVIDGTAAHPAALVECTSDATCTTAGELCLTATSSTTGKACAAPPSDSVGTCDAPTAVTGGTSACAAGAFRCVNGIKKCVGSVRPNPGATDTCGVDQNCDGTLDNQPNTDTDPNNCGACGNVCGAGRPNARYLCQAGSCVLQGCVTGRIDCVPGDGAFQCETECVKTSNTEACNGLDDDCDCGVDAEDVDSPPAVPTPVQACSVSPAALDVGCTTGVAVECVTEGASASWVCTFPPAYCTGAAPDYCVGAPDPCNGIDENCNGIPDEGFRSPLATGDALGDPCYAGIGACRNAGEFECNSAGTGVQCNAQPNAVATEICNGLDDDCDGVTDEDYRNPGARTFVRPPVIQLGASTWMFAYEASRPTATSTDSGSGNGYFDLAPAGETLDRTIACSRTGRLPWVNVTTDEVEQSCYAVGGRACNKGDYNAACWVGAADCAFGYRPVGPACQAFADYTSGPYCNLGAFDYDKNAANGNQNGLLPTASAKLNACAADMSTLFGNSLDAFDITGNVREITRCQENRAICAQGVQNDDALAAAICAADCCAGVGTDTNAGPEGYRWVCGSIGTSDRRLSGQVCRTAGDGDNGRCCNNDATCSGDGICDDGICRSTGTAHADLCIARGIMCSPVGMTQNPLPPCCDGLPCVDGYCGGAGAQPHSVYPVMGGGYVTVAEDGATCDFDFFKVDSTFKLFDTGFRCCFDEDPDP